MNIIMSNLPVLPEVLLLIMACVTLLAGLFCRRWKSLTYGLAQLTLIVTAVLLWYAHHSSGSTAQYLFGHSFVFDPLAFFLKLFILISVFFVFIYARTYNTERSMMVNEFLVLALLSTLGMLVLVSAHNLLTLFLGVELLSLPTYAMVAMQRKNTQAIEAAMKYFIIGALASGMLLYGFSMIFGATQQLDIGKIAAAIASMPAQQNLILLLGLVFVGAGIAFKLGAAPFHMWVPDVYQAAPTSVTLFIATAPKIAAFAMALRLFTEMLPSLSAQWHTILVVVAILSMGIGNFAAIVQTNIKRMLAYSSIAHMGYMLLGLLCASPEGYAAAMFYTVSYSVMTLGAFGMIAIASRAGFEAENIDDFAGLNNHNPGLAFLMLLIMFSLAGVPPLVGFIAKLGVLEALIQAHYIWLAVVALLFAIVGAYYYLRIIKVMYFERVEMKYDIDASWGLKLTIGVNSLAVLVLGCLPGVLYAVCRAIFLPL